MISGDASDISTSHLLQLEMLKDVTDGPLRLLIYGRQDGAPQYGRYTSQGAAVCHIPKSSAPIPTKPPPPPFNIPAHHHTRLKGWCTFNKEKLHGHS